MTENNGGQLTSKLIKSESYQTNIVKKQNAQRQLCTIQYLKTSNLSGERANVEKSLLTVC
jgi:hypothetical protein